MSVHWYLVNNTDKTLIDVDTYQFQSQTLDDRWPGVRHLLPLKIHTVEDVYEHLRIQTPNADLAALLRIAEVIHRQQYDELLSDSAVLGNDEYESYTLIGTVQDHITEQSKVGKTIGEIYA